MKRTCFLVLLLILTALVVGAIGCSKKPKPSTDVSPPVAAPSAEPEPAEPSEPVLTPEPSPVIELEDIFFDYDKFSLKPDACESLTRNAKALLDAPGTCVLIEGHCDERGTLEYNLALGDRRARGARDFLIRYGVDPSRITMISYGEERPFARGHNEAAWALNRRGHFIIRN